MSASIPERWRVVLAFAAIYIIWGSTYFFIREALTGFPPMLLGGLRFAAAGLLMLGWCAITGQDIRPGRALGLAALVGFLLLFVGNGVVVWVERTLPSSVVAILIAVAPLSFVLLDRPQWSVNLRSPSVLLGVIGGFAGVWLLFSGRLAAQVSADAWAEERTALVWMVLAITAWPAGSLLAKYRPSPLPAAVNTAWQMLSGAAAFLLAATARGEWGGVQWQAVPLRAWGAMAYLVVLGSLVGFSAYVWLLTVRPAAQVSTYAYVNPVVAVLFGVLLGEERLGWRELAGLGIILTGVLLINLARYRDRSRR
ncbi:MAG TPA: EamA family transporter [Flavobacteriales bacterium]|nr:EamA family transporter [Flavobacteriales bacterium]HQW85626.1 EamA family transporter [Flavobacteriales bacterium]